MLRICQFAARPVAVPLLVLLYLLPAPVLGVYFAVKWACRNLCLALDVAFDFVAAAAGWDTRFWPLPRSSDEIVSNQR